ncbi:MAG: helix-turn-helix domain-containing protein [Ignavibacteriae bacterium]|nr:helix-turn-helix domain-containing protein [Ignavibacteriota bacterium]
MFQVIYLVDATEPLNLLVGPLFYLYIKAKVDESKINKTYYHFIPSIIYFFYSIFFHIQSLELKYNAYLEQYHPELDFVKANSSFSDPLLLKHYVNELLILSIFLYLVASIIFVYKTQKKNVTSKKTIKIIWVDITIMLVILLTIIFVKITFPHDFGDYLSIVVVTIFIYSMSFKVIRESLFFKKEKDEKKYSKSALDEENKIKILEKINDQINQKYYLNNSPSLPEFAKKVNSSPNYVSQVINEKLNLTFLELINKNRIEEAKNMLLDQNLNETIEGIAYSVGFNSKSTFNSAFKKLTGKTPSEFRNSNQ